ncbi:MAG: bifunctional DNA-formamidopyrimidine glycosylase/DNA-(apurinic or apyrimidinic site) lyase [Candidatus Cloacimonetes bacterium]|nr:bifunctional DNA-formamidopyrimidine glycosylase/DNA-(apurinic or apyrimidinic site) lyase [Candidatus Cloacimonadota bacterium]
MPELPEVHTVLEGLQSALEGRQISALHSYYPGTVSYDPALDYEPFPARVIAGIRRGKYMILNLDNATSLIIHLRMTGKLIYEAQPNEVHKHERARFELDNGAAIRFFDLRTFGKIILLKSENLQNYLPKLGAEPLSPDFTAQYLLQKLKGRKAPIKNLLLDQSIVAGLGNIYVCELLYRARIRPETAGDKITLQQAKEMVKHTVDVLNEAILVGGTSVSDYRRIDDKTGEFQHFLRVYHKEICPLGHEVKRIRQGGRSSFFCPLCQK